MSRFFTLTPSMHAASCFASCAALELRFGRGSALANQIARVRSSIGAVSLLDRGNPSAHKRDLSIVRQQLGETDPRSGRDRLSVPMLD